MLPSGTEIKARVQHFIEDQLQSTMVYDRSAYVLVTHVLSIVSLANKVNYCLYCHFIIQWTGVLIGAAVAISFISIVAFFLHRRYKFGECEIFFFL